MARIPDAEIERLKADVSLARLIESAGIVLHLEAGLPSAEDAIRLAFAQAVPEHVGEPLPAVALRLHEEVLRLMPAHFAWNGPLHLDADVVLDLPDEEALTEAMAELLRVAGTAAPEAWRIQAMGRQAEPCRDRRRRSPRRRAS